MTTNIDQLIRDAYLLLISGRFVKEAVGEEYHSYMAAVGRILSLLETLLPPEDADALGTGVKRYLDKLLGTSDDNYPPPGRRNVTLSRH
jgi:hypothetical protein